MRFPVARLFRKFFLAFFLAQMLTVTAVGLLIWAAGPEPHLPEPDELFEGPVAATPPPAGPPSPAGPAAGAPGPDDRPAIAHPPHHRRPHRHGFPFIPVGIGFLASSLFAFLLARQFAGPILSLRAAFVALGRGNLATRLGPGQPVFADELDDLRTDFDATAAQLQKLVEGQRRLLHDVSHEIRSPVARMQLALDLVRQQPARAAELLDRMERECGRIDLLMEELLTLSRLEARAFGALDQTVDLADIVQAIAEDARFEGQARQVAVVLTAPDLLTCTGHPELLHRALENVVRNALNYSPPGGEVRVTVVCEGRGRPVQLVVEDQGPGVPEADLERIFAPFKRMAGAAGSTAHLASGHGLGLAITREALQAHGGSARAENRSEGGLRVVLTLPG